MELSGGQFLPPVQKLVASTITLLQKKQSYENRFPSAPPDNDSFRQETVVFLLYVVILCLSFHKSYVYYIRHIATD